MSDEAKEGNAALAVASPAEIAGLAPTAPDGSLVAQEAGALSAIAREESEAKAALLLARQFPRDEVVAHGRIMKSCERWRFAKACLYTFPRGGETIEAPSVHLAREAARCWGNVRYGLRIVTETEDRVHVKGFGWDIETNNYVEAEDKFKKLIYRKYGGWIKPDERDLRELINRRGAICVRNALLQLLPPDIIEDAVDAAKATIRKTEAGGGQQDRITGIQKLVLAFRQIGVMTEMLEDHLGHKVEVITDEEWVRLRGTYQSIVDGNSRIEEHFGKPAAKGVDKRGMVEQLKDKKAAACGEGGDSLDELKDTICKRWDELESEPGSALVAEHGWSDECHMRQSRDRGMLESLLKAMDDELLKKAGEKKKKAKNGRRKRQAVPEDAAPSEGPVDDIQAIPGGRIAQLKDNIKADAETLGLARSAEIMAELRWRNGEEVKTSEDLARLGVLQRAFAKAVADAGAPAQTKAAEKPAEEGTHYTSDGDGNWFGGPMQDDPG
jgi:hypothetical protein